MDLVTENVKEYLNQGLDIQSLINEGLAGFNQALELFRDTDDGDAADLASCAPFWIRRHIAEALVMRQMCDQFAIEFEEECNRQPSPVEVMSFIGMKIDKISVALAACRVQYLHSLDTLEEQEAVLATASSVPEQVVDEQSPVAEEEKTTDLKPQPEEALQSPKLGFEISPYLTPFQAEVIQARYNPEKGLQTYGEILHLLGKANEINTASQISTTCRQSLAILAEHNIKPTDLISAETMTAISSLRKDDRSVLVPVFGLDGNQPTTYGKLAKKMGFAIPTIAHRQQRVVEKMRQILEENRQASPPIQAQGIELLPDAIESQAPAIRELSLYLDALREHLLSLRYAIGSNDGLRTYSEVLSLADSTLLSGGSTNSIGIICRESLKTLVTYGVTIENLITPETLAAINKLSDIQQKVIVPLYGIDGNASVSYKSLSQQLDMQPRKVQRIERQAINYIRQMLKSSEAGTIDESRLYIDRKLIDILDPQSQQVLIVRYGLDGSGLHTRQEVGRELGISSTQASEILDFGLNILYRQKGVTPLELLVYPYLLQALKGPNKPVVEKSFGFVGDYALRHMDIAQSLGITPAQSREREIRALKSLSRVPRALQPEVS